MDFGVQGKIEDDSAFTKYIWRLVQSMEGRELWRSWSQKLGETLIETSGAALTNWSPVGNFALSQL